MQWGAEQQRALDRVAQWMTSGLHENLVFRLFGYAGTGKTTLAKHFAEGIKGTVLFGAYTGKAAYVLRSKGCEGATTIHSLIYHTKEKGKARLKDLENSLTQLQVELSNKGMTPAEIALHRRVKDFKKLIEEEVNSLRRPFFTLNPESPLRHASLIVLDECSMIDKQVGEDLLSFGKPILVLGDPAQLPPVGSGGFFTEQTPDVMLTDIRRQARDNPIIELATQVRNKQPLPLGLYGSSSVVTKENFIQQDALAADQLLVGRNRTRYLMNKRVRSLQGYPEDRPAKGDRVVCLRNDHEAGLLNGALWSVENVARVEEDRCWMSLKSTDNDDLVDVEAHMHHFEGREKELPWYEKKEAQEFDYGYALTVHKAQGSQWDKVVLFDESSAFRENRWRWLYTGITRAAEQIQIVKM